MLYMADETSSDFEVQIAAVTKVCSFINQDDSFTLLCTHGLCCNGRKIALREIVITLISFLL